MNITSIDVNSIKDVKIGNKAIVISNNKKDENSIGNIAKKCHVLTYEVMVQIPSKLKRILSN